MVLQHLCHGKLYCYIVQFARLFSYKCPANDVVHHCITGSSPLSGNRHTNPLKHELPKQLFLFGTLTSHYSAQFCAWKNTTATSAKQCFYHVQREWGKRFLEISALKDMGNSMQLLHLTWKVAFAVFTTVDLLQRSRIRNEKRDTKECEKMERIGKRVMLRTAENLRREERWKMLGQNKNWHLTYKYNQWNH